VSIAARRTRGTCAGAATRFEATRRRSHPEQAANDRSLDQEEGGAMDSVVLTEPLAAAPAAWLAQRCRVLRCGSDDTDFASAIRDASGLVVRTYTTVDDRLLRQAATLRVVARAGVGIENIDVAACRERGVEVVYAPDANTQAVVEFVFSLLADVLRPRPRVERPRPLDAWQALRDQSVGRRQLDQLTLGLLGLGRIGRRVAAVAGAYGMRVRYNDLLEIPPADRHGAEPVAVDELFASCDVVSIHVDGRASNREFVGENLLEGLRPEAILLNTSRGFVVDNVALAAAMARRPGAVALLDVHDPEPFGGDYPLLGLSNVRLYPHLAGRTDRALENMSWVVRDVVAVLEGRVPEHPAP
jgi:phosphoglycerate dehydrogenase-like enzyme